MASSVWQTANQRLALDQIVDFEAGQQDLVEHPDDQLRLTDGQTPHARVAAAEEGTCAMRTETSDYTPATGIDAQTDGCRMSFLR